MNASSIQGSSHVVPVNQAAFPLGIQSLDNIGLVRKPSGKGYTLTVSGQATQSGIEVSLGQPRINGLKLSVELATKMVRKTTVAIATPYSASVDINELPKSRINTFVLEIVNAAGERLDSRMVALEPTEKS